MSEDIPGNEHALQKLRGLLGSGKAIGFIGAGASAGLYPLWRQLIRQLADEAVARGLARDEERDFWLGTAEHRPQQVVRGIKEALSEGVYGAVLRDIFRPRAGKDGNRYTPIHGALLRMPFRGYVTTNYDPGLLEARMALRPDVTATGYATWKDPDELERWYTGDIFDEHPCPVLFAHGIYQRSDTVVLGVGEYREAYRPGLYRRVFERLWGQEHLVFVGFGFSDPWLDFIADEVITQTAAQAAAEPRHIAFIGLRNGDRYTPQIRRMYRDQYNAEVYFYRVAITEDGDQDHSDMLRRLEQLALPTAQPARVVIPPAETPPQCWVHETTNDEFYVEPHDALARLDRWSGDPSVRAIAVTGLGGLGKTALIGHWLKERGGDTRRAYRGLFYWSFYADREVRSFFEALLQFAADGLQVPAGDRETRAVEAAKDILRAAPLLIVLDGLEVLQERPGTVAYGALLEHDLREFLDAACRLDHTGLVVLTSRFPFPDLTPHLGLCLRALDLDHLTPEEGAALLARCDVGGAEAERRDVSERLEGHPLALRVFGAALASQADGDPTRFSDMVFEQSGLSVDDPLEAKLGRLLIFYERQLPPQRTTLLGIVSLFRTPVGEATIRTLARKLSGAREVLREHTEDSLRQELDALCNARLLFRDSDAEEVDAYSCHPVLRDHFRRAVLASDDSVASSAADLLSEPPASERPTDIRELEPVLTAIELLLDAEDFKRADQLYVGRLERGYLLRRLPAPRAGLECALGFVGTPERRRRCGQQLSERRVSFYLNEAGLNAQICGELGHAAGFYRHAAAIDKRIGDEESLSRQLLNHAHLLALLGDLRQAETLARESQALPAASRDAQDTRNSLAYLAWILALQGRVREAGQAFEQADAIEQRIDPDAGHLYSTRGIWWADLDIRIGRSLQPRHLTQRNLEKCRAEGWFQDLARCHWILGRLDTAQGRLRAAGEHLNQAQSVMRTGHMLANLPSLLVAQAELGRRQGAWDDAVRYTEEALALAAPRELRLAHADALVMRGRIVLDRAQAAGEPDSEETRLQLFRTQDDAESALRIARDCGYAWAERDALALLADVYHALGDAGNALRHRRDADALSRRLRLDPSD